VDALINTTPLAAQNLHNLHIVEFQSQDMEKEDQYVPLVHCMSLQSDQEEVGSQIQQNLLEEMLVVHPSQFHMKENTTKR